MQNNFSISETLGILLLMIFVFAAGLGCGLMLAAALLRYLTF